MSRLNEYLNKINEEEAEESGAKEKCERCHGEIKGEGHPIYAGNKKGKFCDKCHAEHEDESKKLKDWADASPSRKHTTGYSPWS